MKTDKGDLTVANRFTYYYANFLDRIYGFVQRREGKNIPDERYVGRLRASRRKARRKPARSTGRRQPPTRGERLWKEDLREAGRVRRGSRTGDPKPGEIVLFHYRKRLMLGLCGEAERGRIPVVAEDRRRLNLRRSSLVYLSGVDASDDRGLFRTYAASVRALSAHIDLSEIWELVAEDREALSIPDIAGLYWEGDIDASRWIALYLHLNDRCPYFEAIHTDTFLPLSTEDVSERQRLHRRRQAQGHEWEEFVHWLSLEGEDPYDPETLTDRQRGWLEQVRQYALWGTDARGWKQAREILSGIASGTGDLQRRAFALLVRKGLWGEDENLDLIRAEIPLEFPEAALRMAGEADMGRVLRARGRRRLWRRRLFSIRIPGGGRPDVAFSLRRRLWRGYELGVHIPDVAALVPAGSALDRAAADRLSALDLPDREIPMLPSRLSEDLGRLRLGQRRPALSLLWKLGVDLTFQGVEIVPSVVTNRRCLTCDEVETICEGGNHPLGNALRILNRLTGALRSAREAAGAVAESEIPGCRVGVADGEARLQREAPEEARARRMVQELAILASVEVGKWCAARGLPAMYETGEVPGNRDALDRIPDPIVRRHEIRRQMPSVAFGAQPGFHHGQGTEAGCPVVSPCSRYPDLMVQRQVLHYLFRGEILHPPEEIDRIRYRAQEELREARALQYRRERHWLLKQLSASIGRVFPAVVLHIRRDGALVELVDLPLKTVVRPQMPVTVGEGIRVRIVGVDLWRSQMHASAI